MRVISGTAKGRNLKSPGAATRPITDRAKESLFNILGTRVIDANVLDLFAGAGSVGIEALSRGARHATFVELDRDALRAIRENLELTRLMDRATVVREEVFKFIRHESVLLPFSTQQDPRGQGSASVVREKSRAEYDVIYVAPPQYRELWLETLKTLDGRGFLSERGLVIAQIHPKEFRAYEFTEFELSDQRKYGSTLLCFYSRRTPKDSPGQ